jgi:hypothetical protein
MSSFLKVINAVGIVMLALLDSLITFFFLNPAEDSSSPLGFIILAILIGGIISVYYSRRLLALAILSLPLLLTLLFFVVA